MIPYTIIPTSTVVVSLAATVPDITFGFVKGEDMAKVKVWMGVVVGLVFWASFGHAGEVNGVATRYLGVCADESIVEDKNPQFAVNADKNRFVVDGNESRGAVTLYFDDPGEPATRFKELSLGVNIADVSDAESNDGFSVFAGTTKVGTIKKFGRKSTVDVPLDVSAIKSAKSLKLIIKANGDDGFYMQSKASGFGAFLKLVY